MNRKFVALLIWAAAVLLPSLSLQAQCTASVEEAAAAEAAIEGAALGSWPLEVPRGAQILDYGDFRGALLLAGSTVYQIENITWRIADNGALDIRELAGHTRDGVSTRFTRSGGKTIDSVADTGGFILGNPDGDGRKIQIQSLSFATDGDGFLTIRQMTGVDLGTGTAVALDAAQDPAPDGQCGLRVSTGCNSGNCNGGACGAAPGCPCNGKTGSCSGYSNSVCSGKCPDGMVCNGSVEDCKCIPKPAVPPAGGGGGDATGGGL